MAVCYNKCIIFTGGAFMYDMVRDIFMPLNTEEIQQRRTGQWVTEFVDENNLQGTRLFNIQTGGLFQEHNILIRQHRRFASYPLHSHQFLEFNYMYSGSSKQIVNGIPLELKTGHLLLLDTNSKHELAPLNENDILLNFLFKTSDINIALLKKINRRSSSLTHDFLMNALFEFGYNETHLLLDLSKEPEIQVTLDQMILEYFSGKPIGNEVLNAYSQVLFLQLSRVYQSQLAKIYKKDVKSSLMIKVLQQIEDEYKTLTLGDLARNLGYNANYLSNLIKAQTGQTFKKLVTDQKLHEAHSLVLSTNLSVYDIAEYVGFSNKTQFYCKYREYFGDTPTNIRRIR